VRRSFRHIIVAISKFSAGTTTVCIQLVAIQKEAGKRIAKPKEPAKGSDTNTKSSTAVIV
jgi:hypothetical protein